MNSNLLETDTVPFVIISYNIHSLQDFCARVERLLKEIGDRRWDLIVLTETWRAERVEVWRTDDGHTWLGSGGTKRQRGVGFLLHARWKHSRFKPLSERIGVIDVKLTCKTVVRVIGIYMPHGAKPDEDVEQVYSLIEEQRAEADVRSFRTILAGDLNAEVGAQTDFDDPAIIGPSSIPNRSERGSWLLTWCTLHRYRICNTFGRYSADQAWTYRNGALRKILDYILVDQALARTVLECFVLADVDTGSDHRPLLLSLGFHAKKGRKKKRKRIDKRWKPDNHYIDKLTSLLAECRAESCSAQAKADKLQKALLQACEATAGVIDEPSVDLRLYDAQLRNLILMRRSIPSLGLSRHEANTRRISLCKQIQKVIRQKRSFEQDQKICAILKEFRDLKRLSSILGPSKSHGIVEIRDTHGNLKHDREEIADVFACFYEDRYKSKDAARGPSTYKHFGTRAIDPFTREELRETMKQMKAGKARDAAGICAEMLKVDCPLLQDIILEVFNDVLKGGHVPSEWRSSRLVAIFKKKYPSLPSNYRHIAILPILYKLFSRMLCGRIKETITKEQSVDQAAYRRGFSTEDHLITLTLLFESCREWNVPLWFGLVDFEKAFDTVEHAPLWRALDELGVGAEYIDMLKTLYCKQESTVRAGCDSRAFALERGVKQGDPISSVMEVMFRRLKARWSKLNSRRTGPYYGIVIDDPLDPLTNLRFADDVLLVAVSRTDVRKMIADLQKEALMFGLKMHAGKTKILTTDRARRQTPASCGGHDVEVLQNGCFEKYLGRKFSVDDFHTTELTNRLSMGWAVFFKFKGALCNKYFAIKDRMALFVSCVTPCVLYACGTWTMTSDMEHK